MSSPATHPRLRPVHRRAGRSRARLVHARKTLRKCAPGRGGDGVSCFTQKELVGIARAWNASYAPAAVAASASPSSISSAHQHALIDLRLTRTKAALWRAINERMRDTSTCVHERCWLTTTAMKVVGGGHVKHAGEAGAHRRDDRPRSRAAEIVTPAALDAKAFRPRMPSGWRTRPNMWLSNVDIERVLRQHATHDPSFRFIGAVPIDFASPSDTGEMGKCVTQALCRVRVRRWWREGARRLGIVFNLDPHDQSGSHWTSAFLDFERNAIFYYDSFGSTPPHEVHQLFQSVGAQLEDMHGSPPHVQHNDLRHQFHNTECGVYCVHFLTFMLRATQRGKCPRATYADFVRQGKTDEEMKRYRRVFYDDS